MAALVTWYRISGRRHKRTKLTLHGEETGTLLTLPDRATSKVRFCAKAHEARVLCSLFVGYDLLFSGVQWHGVRLLVGQVPLYWL